MDDTLVAYLARREVALARVRKLLVEELHIRRSPEEIDPDTPLWGTGLGLDSVDAVELVMSLDAVLGVHLPDDAHARASLRTVNTLVDLVLASAERHVAS